LIALLLCGLSSSEILFGAFDNNIIQEYYQVALRYRGYTNAVTAWLGKNQTVIHFYADFCFDFDQLEDNINQMQFIWDHGSIPLLTWEPGNQCNGHANDDAYQLLIPGLVASGQYDDFLGNFSIKIANEFLSGPDFIMGTSDDRRLYVALAPEMNGDWETWSGNGTVFANMWRRVVDVFENYGLDDRTRINWIFTPTTYDIDAVHTMESYYPGNYYVDWFGIDGFNSGDAEPPSVWVTPADIFDDMINRIRTLSPGTPIALIEVASTSVVAHGPPVNHNHTAKWIWVSQLYSYVQDRDIRMVVYFNIDKETDWGIYGYSTGDELFTTIYGTSYNASSIYRLSVQTPIFFPSDLLHNRRQITDDQFQGLGNQCGCTKRFVPVWNNIRQFPGNPFNIPTIWK